MIKKGIIKELGLENDMLEEAMLSLTHKCALNENAQNNRKNDIEFYGELGKSIYSILLKNFISKNVSYDISTIENYFKSSKYVYIIRFFEFYRLKELIICREDIVNDKTIQNLTMQFIGFLYLKTSYDNIKRVFEKIFDTESLNITDDYLSVIMAYSDGKAKFNEISITGLDHCREFEYELVFKGRSIISKGTSKKNAKQKCSKIYCNRYLTKEEIFKSLGIKLKNNKKNKRVYKYKLEQLQLIKYISDKLDIEIGLLKQALTHKSMSNEYNIKDNSSMVSIGSDIEKAHLLIYINNKFKDMDFYKKYEVVSYLQAHIKIMEIFIDKYRISDSILVIETMKNNCTNKVYRSVFRGIIYSKFFTNNKYEFLKELEVIYDEILYTTDLRYINSTTNLQEFLQDIGITDTNYTFENSNYNSLICKVHSNTLGSSLCFNASGINKKEAKENVSREFLRFIYDEFEPFCRGEKKINSSNVNKIKDLVYYILLESNITFKNIIVKNYFGLNDLKLNKLEDFTTILFSVFKYIRHNFNKEINEFIVNSLINIVEKINVILSVDKYNVLSKLLIYDIWESESSYNIKKRYKYLNDKSAGYINKLIENNGLLIASIKEPSPELQMLAIKNNPKALYYIKNPSKEVYKYISTNDKKYENYILSNSIDLNNFLIENVVEELECLIDRNKSNLEFYMILKNIKFEVYIKSLFKIFNINKLYIATGYVYSSGIELIYEEIDKLINSNGTLKFFIGSLQNYKNDELVRDMDKKTCKVLNKLINRGCEIKTNTEQFYHGKMYYFESNEISIIIMGSTNLSKTAFHKNNELNCIYFYRNKQMNPFLNRFEEIWSKEELIDFLEENKFSERLDGRFNIENNFKSVSQNEVERKINLIPDEILRKRLLLWLDYKPSNIYEDIIVANKDYIAIEYIDKSMIVLESFLPGNSYFVFYDIDISELLNIIKNKTKTEIFKLSNMEKRGYHVREALTLELNIKSYFLY